MVVTQSQEALFFEGGEAPHLFLAGTYTLPKSNAPLFKSLMKIPFGRRTLFAAEVYFINKTSHLDMKWGTSVPFQIMDPKYNMMLTVRAFGQYGITVSNSRVFVTSIIGAVSGGHVSDYNTVTSLFTGLINVKVKEVISKCIIRKGISLLDIHHLLGEISDECRFEINAAFSRYGIEVVTFYVESINFPDDEVQLFKDALSKKRVLATLGEDYYRQRSLDILENRASSRFSFGQETLGSGSTSKERSFCPTCNVEVPAHSKFCGQCGSPIEM
ncbi:SPFH domain-containing protein [Tumebacillus sp. ITR2]|uniref:SPFH domain-containing protein n=1 Tax=Tumebacillus amylolyticus TaxID=2801339 RepID=A0ABS1J9F3_9BACL|nr:SPFH domain-containing protein [Tumebacillus amylolyticus]